MRDIFGGHVFGLLLTGWVWLSGLLSAATPQPGAIDPTFDPGLGADGPVNALIAQSDGKILVGGNFLNFSGRARGGILRLNSDGTVDPSFGTGSGSIVNYGNTALSGGVDAVQLLPDGRIVIGGMFQAYDGEPVWGLAQLNADGSLNKDFKPPQLAGVWSLARQSTGKILVGGGFGPSASHPGFLMRLHADGNVDATFGGMSSLDGGVLSIASFTDDRTMISGFFSRVGSIARPHLARLNANGTRDSDYELGSNMIAPGQPVLSSVKLQADGRVLVAGTFTNILNVNCGGIVRLLSDGSMDPNFTTGWGTTTAVAVSPSSYYLLPGPVTSMSLQPDGKVLIGGTFTSYSGISRRGVARLHVDGSLDTLFDPGTGAPEVRAIALQGDGRVLVGGTFTNWAGATRMRLARLQGDTAVQIDPPVITTQPASQSVSPGAIVSFRVHVSGTGPLSYQWRFNGVPLTAATTSMLTINNVRPEDGGSYTVTVSNAAGFAHSDAAVLTVRVPPTITTQPPPLVSASAGQPVSMNVVASGTAPLSYQWLRNGTNVPGAVGATLNFSAVTSADAGTYAVVVTNVAGTVTSETAFLVVNANPPVIVTPPAGQAVVLASPLIGPSVLATRLLHLAILDGGVPFSDSGAYDMTFSATRYSSPAGGGLSAASGGSYSVSLGPDDRTVILLNTYFSNGAAGKIDLLPDGNYELYASGVANNQSGRWTLNPPYAAEPGPSVTFEVSASGTPPLEYQWYFNNSAMLNATSASLTLTNVTKANLGIYAVEVSNAGGVARSAGALLQETAVGPGPALEFQVVSGTVLVVQVPTGYELQRTDRLIAPTWTSAGTAGTVLVSIEGPAAFFRLSKL